MDDAVVYETAFHPTEPDVMLGEIVRAGTAGAIWEVTGAASTGELVDDLARGFFGCVRWRLTLRPFPAHDVPLNAPIRELPRLS